MDKVQIYIPISGDERRFIRDELAISLRNSYDVVIIHFDEINNFSIIEILVHDVSRDISFFKKLVDMLSTKIDETIILKTTKEMTYISQRGKLC